MNTAPPPVFPSHQDRRLTPTIISPSSSGPVAGRASTLLAQTPVRRGFQRHSYVLVIPT